MAALDRTDWEILDATADDYEDLEQIFLAVCFEVVDDRSAAGTTSPCCRRVREDLLLGEIADRIRKLVDQGFLRAVDEDEGHDVANKEELSYVWRSWFQMTPQGRAAWETPACAEQVDQPH
jgi:hypothetical protein